MSSSTTRSLPSNTMRNESGSIREIDPVCSPSGSSTSLPLPPQAARSTTAAHAIQRLATSTHCQTAAAMEAKPAKPDERADERVEANRRMWDERVPIHVSSAFYDVDGWKAGR